MQTGALRGLPQVALHLQPQPETGRSALCLGQAQVHVGSQRRMPVQDAGQHHPADADVCGKSALAHPEVYKPAGQDPARAAKGETTPRPQLRMNPENRPA